MKIIRKLLAFILFVIAGIALASLAISIPRFDEFYGSIISILLFGTISSLFTLGAILLWNKRKWKVLLRNFIAAVGIFALLISILSPFITDWVFSTYEYSDVKSFESLWINAIIGAVLLLLSAYSINYFIDKNDEVAA